MNYCSQCGIALRVGIPAGDNRNRHICDSCGTIHYQNPKIIAGCLPLWEERILLCKRAIEPRKGFWTLPAGFMEMGETVAQAACRETLEESEAKVTIQGLYTVFDLPAISQVYLFFRAQMLSDHHSTTSESFETRLFHEAEIPWDNIAFTTVKRALRLFIEDRKANHFPIRLENIGKDPYIPR